MNTNAMIQDLSETDCMQIEGGLTCEDICILVGAGLGGAIGGAYGGVSGAFTGARLGGAAGEAAAGLICR